MLARFKKKARLRVEVPLASLIDIVFLLLIYFLLTTNFMVDEGIKVKLPQANASADLVEETITVYVDKQGRSFVAGEQVAPEGLLEKLRHMLADKKEKLVVVKADREVLLNHVVKAMNMAKAAGAERLCLATEKEM